MYPFLRFFKELFVSRKAPPLGPLDTHVSHHICWPIDLDMFAELNNGRTLTLYDFGRFGLAQRAGMLGLLRKKGWAFTVAGSSVRYRRRVTMFQRLEMRTRLTAWDDRFMYMEQSMWRRGECTSHMLIRTAVIGKRGIVPMAEVAEAMGISDASPEMPGWIAAWAKAEGQRPWPPMQA